MSKTEIYYFTGTGNSLFIARELERRIPDSKIIPIVGLLDKKVIKTSGERVGFVFPVYMAALPIPVKKFVEKLELDESVYTFAVATRIGTMHGAFSGIDKVLGRKGKLLNAFFNLNMPSNDPKFDYKTPTEDEITKLEAEAKLRLDSIEKIILAKEKSREKDIYYTQKVPFVGLLSSLADLTGGMDYNLYADSKCTGCGSCEKVCLSGKIRMEEGKPVWQKDIKCYKCSACLNYCPAQAAQIKSYTEKNGRYTHPYATIDEIAGQKEIIP
ncbi:MAG TPA: EFR1 family ferrodoxin [Clostridia bacterium]|nr:EFR1 family ferrodoxin [Clostridia bacterium]